MFKIEFLMKLNKFHVSRFRENFIYCLLPLKNKKTKLNHNSHSHLLQIKSVVVRKMVDEARERHNARNRNAQIFMDQLAELRSMKWAMQNHFELAL